MSIKTNISLGTGLLAGILCWAIGIDYAVLWGVIAFLLHYIPNFGSLIASIPPLLLGFVQFGWEGTLAVLIGYIIINTIMGNIIEPRVMGRTTGLSPLVVLLAMLIWGFVLGPVGAILAVPLTMSIKIIFEHDPELKRIAFVMGEGSTVQPAAVTDDVPR